MQYQGTIWIPDSQATIHDFRNMCCIVFFDILTTFRLFYDF